MPRTIEQVQTEINEWEACLAAIRTGQEYWIANRRLTRPDLATVYKIVKDLRKELSSLERGGRMRVTRIVPRDL